jgi:uncharacterized protein (TIGR02284 family)
MHTHNDEAVKTINGLIETTLDSAAGYQEAAENVDDPQLKTLFADRAQERTRISHTLQAEVRSFGGKPEDDQSLVGKAHNKLVDIKAALAGGHSDKAVVDEVERGEDFIKGKFEKVLKKDDLPAEARTRIEEAYASIKADHDRISALKHAMH